MARLPWQATTTAGHCREAPARSAPLRRRYWAFRVSGFLFCSSSWTDVLPHFTCNVHSAFFSRERRSRWFILLCCPPSLGDLLPFPEERTGGCTHSSTYAHAAHKNGDAQQLVWRTTQLVLQSVVLSRAERRPVSSHGSAPSTRSLSPAPSHPADKGTCADQG